MTAESKVVPRELADEVLAIQNYEGWQGDIFKRLQAALSAVPSQSPSAHDKELAAQQHGRECTTLPSQEGRAASVAVAATPTAQGEPEEPKVYEPDNDGMMKESHPLERDYTYVNTSDYDALRSYARRQRGDYEELIMAVSKKWPNETRHQTALDDFICSGTSRLLG
jgi:hypothetical protein